MSNKVGSLTERFMKYGMDISSYNIQNEVQKYEFYYYIQIYVNEILKNKSLLFIYENNLYIFDDDGPVLAFAITSKYDTIIPVALSTQKDDLCHDIIKCFLIMIKDMRDMMPHIVADAMKDSLKVMNKIKKMNLYHDDNKKYNLKEILKGIKKI